MQAAETKNRIIEYISTNRCLMIKVNLLGKKVALSSSLVKFFILSVPQKKGGAFAPPN